MDKETIEQKARELYPASVDYPSAKNFRAIQQREAFISGYRLASQRTEELERDLEDFTEWVGTNYVKLHKVWVHRYASQTQPENFLTYAQLREVFKRYQKSLRDLINPLPQPPTTKL